MCDSRKSPNANHNAVVFSSGWANPQTIIQEYNEENVIVVMRLACYLHFEASERIDEAWVYKRERELPLPVDRAFFLVSRIMQSLSACAATRVLRVFEVDWSVGR